MVGTVLFAMLCFQGMAQPQTGGYPEAADSSATQSNWRKSLSPELQRQLDQHLADLKDKARSEVHVISESGHDELRELKAEHDAAASEAQQKLARAEAGSLLKQAHAEDSLQKKLDKLKDKFGKKQQKLEERKQQRLDEMKKEYKAEESKVLDRFRHVAEKAWIDQFPKKVATPLILEDGTEGKVPNASQSIPSNKPDDWSKVLSPEEGAQLKSSLESLQERLQEAEGAITNKTEKKLEAVKQEFSRKEKKAVAKLTKKIEKMQKKEIRAKVKLQKTLNKLEDKSKSTQKRLEEVGPRIVRQLEDEYEDKKSELLKEFKEKAAEIQEAKAKERKEEKEELAKQNATNTNQTKTSDQAGGSLFAGFAPVSRRPLLDAILLVAAVSASALIYARVAVKRSRSLLQPLMEEDVETQTEVAVSNDAP